MIKNHSRFNLLVIFGLIPVGIYFVSFILLIYPAILKFSTHIFADTKDGLQNYWNIWWVNKAVVELRQSPFSTNFLHYPYGINLIGHTLNPFNGLLGIPLLTFLSLTQVYNFIVIFSFVVGGLTAFYLSYYLTRSYFGSIIAGYIFTFSNFHFAHAQGHMQLISLEWIPLFILSWIILTNKPTIWKGLFSGIMLFLVILCDYYYFFYSVLAAVIIFIWQIKRRRFNYFLKKSAFIPLIIFSTTVLLTSGIIVADLFYHAIFDGFSGAHKASSYSLDLLAPFIPGGHWRFANLTKDYWQKLPGNIHESSVQVGLSVFIILVYAWNKRSKSNKKLLHLLFFLLLFFLLLSIGPIVHIWGKSYLMFLPTPYTLMGAIIPVIKLSGVPVRMMVMVMLFSGTIFSFGVKEILKKKTLLSKLGILLLLLMLVIEYLPRPIPLTQIKAPSYVTKLKELPEGGSVIDAVSNRYFALYYQTIYQKPRALGYIARTPKSVSLKDRQLLLFLERKDFSSLHNKYGFNYLLISKEQTTDYSCAEVIFSDDDVEILDLNSCVSAPTS